MIKRILFFCLSLYSSTLLAQALQNPTQLIDSAQQFLETQAESYPGSASVHIHTPVIRNQVQCDDLQPFLPSGARLRSRMMVSMRCQSPEAWTMNVQAELNIQGYYYVANQTLQIGETVQLDNLSAREGDLLRLGANTLIDPSHIIGYITTQRITAGSVIKSNALRDPMSILRGQTVKTIAKGTGFVVTSEGQAMQNASPGNQVQVRVSSGQVITGTVIDAQTVQILM